VSDVLGGAGSANDLGGNRILAALARRRSQLARLVRYTATSVVSFAVSEVLLLVLYGTGTLKAGPAALIANVVATVPSYLMSRYWIWRDAPRNRVGRQVVLYWSTSAVCILLTSLATGAIGRLADGHRYHLAIVGLGFLVVNVVFWLGKFALYHWVIFPGSGDGRIPAAQVDRGAPSGNDEATQEPVRQPADHPGGAQPAR
jgi:putative flippase GtrA